ncbi:hypothetical protein GOODEAATRI_010904, partial [Goodea atripinnis]
LASAAASTLVPHPALLVPTWKFFFIKFLLITDVQHPLRPKEKLHPDSNNNENSVPKDFDTIDSNSNLGARSQRQRLRKLEKNQSMLGNEVLKHIPNLPKVHNQTHIQKALPHLPTLPAPAQGSNQDPPFFQTKRLGSPPLPPGLEPHKEQPQCEISGKEAISALSRAKSRECRQQIVEVYCKHKGRALMPEKVPRFCPIEGESIWQETVHL